MQNKDLKETITAKGTEITVISGGDDNDYISLTDIARYKSDDPTATIQNWLRNKDTIVFLGLWEQLNNPNFKHLEFEVFRNAAGANAFTLAPKKWIESTNAIGITSKSGRYGGTFAHKDIAFEFASWISAEFKLYIPLLQFKSVTFRGVVQLIYKLDNLVLNSNEKNILLDLFASGDSIQFVSPNCTSAVHQWIEAFSNECEYIANRMNIGVLDNGSILFLYKPEVPDIDDCSDFQDGYSLYWAKDEKFWVLRYGREAKYYFELPAELIDIWANKYKTNMRESALRLKEEYLKSIAVYTKDREGKPGIDILTLSPTFINNALSSHRNAEINQ